MPYRFVYPLGSSAPQLSADGSSTLSDPDGVELFVWDCNHPESPDCRLLFHRDSGKIHFEYLPTSGSPEFTSHDSITLGMMRHGDYMLSDHDLPFSGPFGLTTFIIDFLLAGGPPDPGPVGPAHREFRRSARCRNPRQPPLLPARGHLPAPGGDRSHADDYGQRCWYLRLPLDHARWRIDSPSERHHLSRGAGCPGNERRRDPDPLHRRSREVVRALSIARVVNNQARALAISGVGGSPGNDVDITLSPELSVVRVGNRGAARNLTVKALSVDRGGQPVDRNLPPVAVPKGSDLAVAVTNWRTLDLQAQAVPFS